MIKRTVIFIAFLFCALGGYAGYRWYENRQTPQYATQQFIKALQSGPQESYAWLTNDLRYNREVYWKEYLADFTGQAARPGPHGGSTLEDRFNTYADSEKPYREIYIFDLNGKKYWLTIVLIYQDKGWKVDELFGSYQSD
jgi:hypothetical protein